MSGIIGTETEFGLSVKGEIWGDVISNAVFLVNSYPYLFPSSPLWDYENENPLLDARGFEADGERERPGADYNRLLNKLLANGGRFYVDGAHPEYSTPECSTPRELVIYEKAGERILALAVEFANRRKASEGGGGKGSRFSIFKNNSDHKGNGYGYHENYLVDRAVPFDLLVAQVTPFLVTRQIYAGAGKVGSDVRGDSTPYQISQRADFFEAWVDLNTMVKRPIINTRDEPHADPDRYRRLHVIAGDANMSEVTTYLKVGTLMLVLAMIEAGVRMDGMALADPVRNIKEISRDLTLTGKYRLQRGVALSAVEIQRGYLEAAERHFENPDDVTRDILQRWRSVLDKLETDPRQLSREIDWVIKRDLLEAYMERKECGWHDLRLSMIDLQYHDVVYNKGLYYALERGGRVEQLVLPEEVEAAQTTPPPGTRAYFRGVCLKKFSKDVYAASWGTILFSKKEGAIQKILLVDPKKGNKESVGPLLEKAKTVDELLSLLAG